MENDSPLLFEKVGQAIEGAVANDGGIHVSYLAVVHWIDADGQQVMSVSQSAEQLPHTTLGLVEYAREVARAELTDQVFEFDIDDD